LMGVTPSNVGYLINPILGDPAVTTGAVLIQTGTGTNQRIGNRIKVTKIEIMLHVTPQAGATMTDGSTLRVMIVKDKQAAGATPAFQSIVNAVATRVAETGLQNPDWTRRFTILKDFNHVMVVTGTNGATVVACGPPMMGKITLRPNQIVTYTTSGGAAADINGVNWYILTAATDSAGVCCTVEGRWIVHYTDF